MPRSSVVVTERNGERARESRPRRDSLKAVGETVRVKYVAGGIADQSLVVAAKAVAGGKAWPIDHVGKRLPERKVVICRHYNGDRSGAGSPVKVIPLGNGHHVNLFPASPRRGISTVPKDACRPIEECAHAHPEECKGCCNNKLNIKKK